MEPEVLNDLAKKLPNLLPFYALAAAAVLLIALMWMRRPSRRRKKKTARAAAKLAIRLADLGTVGPHATGPQLCCFGAPVRLALLVIAPAGREGRLPPEPQMGDVLDRAVPGLGKVFNAHQPVIHRWPNQLSAGGFEHAFFRQCGLPQEGAGTPWCSVAGPIMDGEQRFFIGLLMRSGQANNLKQLAIGKETQWLEILRVSEA
jgi:hypothetical protein